MGLENEQETESKVPKPWTLEHLRFAGVAAVDTFVYDIRRAAFGSLGQARRVGREVVEAVWRPREYGERLAFFGQIERARTQVQFTKLDRHVNEEAPRLKRRVMACTAAEILRLPNEERSEEDNMVLKTLLGELSKDDDFVIDLVGLEQEDSLRLSQSMADYVGVRP